MSKIIKLPTELANQIAAGEVIERPASVIKELIENSLDAGATKIDIWTECSGQKRIVIKDNGSGIDGSELELAFTRHATSKISSFEDLMNLDSLGFRGEALASIASIAQVELTSRPAHQEVGAKLCLGGLYKTLTQYAAPHPLGSTIEVIDLFYNTPARKKFLKSTKTEQAAIMQLLERFGVCYPEIEFNYISNGVQLFSWKAVQKNNHIKRYEDVLGDISPWAKELSYAAIKCSVHGVVFDGSAPEKFRKLQWFFVNGRAVRDKVLLHALKSTCQLPLGAVLLIECCPSLVDMNVHPTKHEVRFQDNRYMHELVRQAILSVHTPILHRLVQPRDLGVSRNLDGLGVQAVFKNTTVDSNRERYPTSITQARQSCEPKISSYPVNEALDDINIPTAAGSWQSLGWRFQSWFFCELNQKLLVCYLPQLARSWLAYFYESNSSAPSHALLFPSIIDIQDFHSHLVNNETLYLHMNTLGFVIDKLEGSKIRIRSVPQWLPSIGVEERLKQLFFDILAVSLTGSWTRQSVIRALQHHVTPEILNTISKNTMSQFLELAVNKPDYGCQFSSPDRLEDTFRTLA